MLLPRLDCICARRSDVNLRCSWQVIAATTDTTYTMPAIIAALLRVEWIPCICHLVHRAVMEGLQAQAVSGSMQRYTSFAYYRSAVANVSLQGSTAERDGSGGGSRHPA